MKLVICTPSTGMVSVEFVKSLTETVVALSKLMSVSVNIKTGAFLPHVRARVCGASMERGSSQVPFNDASTTHLLMVDSDVIFTPEQVVALINRKVDFVSGMYPYSTEMSVKEEDKQIVAGMWDEAAFEKQFLFPPLRLGEVAGLATNGLLKVDWCGLGFCLVRTAVFARIEYPWFESERLRIKNVVDTASEDVSFCRKLSRAGVDIWLDTNVRVGHQKSYII